jgi:hypothetical protein
MRNLRTSLAALLALVAAAFGAAGAAQAASPTATLGVYRGGGAADQVAGFERWNGGQRAAYALEFLPMDGWASIERPAWLASRWRGAPQRVVYSVPLLPRSGGSLAQGATGAYDGHFAAMARTLVAHGQGHASLRLGWEFNGDWFPWAAGRNPAAFVAYWRRVVTAIRGVPGAAFTIDWAPNLGRGAIAPDRVYPGDAYVDVIGLDAYDQDWSPAFRDPIARWRSLMDQPYGLAWHRDFAAAHGKPMSFPEWGMIDRYDGHGGGDDPYYVRQMHDWIAANRVAYHCYFEFDTDQGRHRMTTGRFPAGAAEYRRLFGPGGGATAPAPARAAVRVTSVRRLAGGGRVLVAGTVARAHGGSVRLELRARLGHGWRLVHARTAAVRRAGRFTTVLRHAPAGRFRLVARYRGRDGSAALAVISRR